MDSASHVYVDGLVFNGLKSQVILLIHKKLVKKKDKVDCSIKSFKLETDVFRDLGMDSLDLLELDTEIFVITGSRQGLDEITFKHPNRLTIGDILAKCD